VVNTGAALFQRTGEMTTSDKHIPWLDVMDKWIVRFTIITGGLGLAFMVLLTFWNVIVMRKALNAPILGAEDLLILNLVLIVAIAIPFGGRVGAHIEIEILEARMSPGFARWSHFALRLVGMFLIGTLAWRLFESGVSASKFGEATQQLLISYEPFYYILSTLVGVYALILLTDAIQLVIRGYIRLIDGFDGE
jgi:TRAP-type C4-dicarboxylate transport system permease small subunit|tara:strand:+ start:2292 stop:2870 length:579 start_codon:yes stop_codon:yes gene_type:complete